MKKTSIFKNIKSFFRSFKQTIFLFSLRGSKTKCPLCNSSFRKFLPAGIPRRKNAQCPKCNSLERHRLIWLYLQQKTNFFTAPLKVLHIAQEPSFIAQCSTLTNLDYINADLNSTLAATKMDITNIPYPDNSFDCILCIHVLEHIQDDNKAISELYRVLKPNGWAIIQVPIVRQKTFEDDTITSAKDRITHFGQADHVRAYGLDYKDRLAKNGFLVTVYPFLKKLPKTTISYYRLTPSLDELEDIYYCTK